MTDIYAVVVEGNTEAPILMEMEGPKSTREAAEKHLNQLVGPGSRWFRGCVVRLEFECGNQAVLATMQGLQK